MKQEAGSGARRQPICLREGETLREKLDRETQPGTEDVFEITTMD